MMNVLKMEIDELKVEVKKIVEAIKGITPNVDKPMTRQETAEYLGVSLPTLDKRIREGIIEASQLGDGTIRIMKSDIDKALAKGRLKQKGK